LSSDCGATGLSRFDRVLDAEFPFSVGSEVLSRKETKATSMTNPTASGKIIIGHLMGDGTRIGSTVRSLCAYAVKNFRKRKGVPKHPLSMN
jgi:hypothetical protein